jgi:hypothetical protein
MTHTKDLLAAELRKIGLNEMADRAATGYYHDYLSPLDLPEITLVNHLSSAEMHETAAGHPDQAAAINALRQRVINGDFDASEEESDEWAASEDGQAAFRKLIRDD